MGRTFKDQVAADFAANVTNPDEFGEWVTFWPGKEHGSPRRMVVVCKETENYEQREMGDEQLEQLEVKFNRDESSPRGGVADLAINDVIHRDFDPEDVNYVWSGEVVPGTRPHKLVAVFNRSTEVRGGSMQKEAP